MFAVSAQSASVKRFEQVLGSELSSEDLLKLQAKFKIVLDEFEAADINAYEYFCVDYKPFEEKVVSNHRFFAKLMDYTMLRLRYGYSTEKLFC